MSQSDSTQPDPIKPVVLYAYNHDPDNHQKDELVMLLKEGDVLTVFGYFPAGSKEIGEHCLLLAQALEKYNFIKNEVCPEH